MSKEFFAKAFISAFPEYTQAEVTKVQDEVDKDVYNYHQQFLQKGLKLIYPTVQDEELHSLAEKFVIYIMTEDTAPEHEQRFEETFAMFKELNMRLNLASEQQERTMKCIDDLIDESLDEMRLYCTTKAQEFLFGASTALDMDVRKTTS